MTTKPVPAELGRPASNLTGKSRFNWVRVWGKFGFLVRGRGREWEMLTPAPHPPLHLTRSLKYTLLNFLILFL